MEALTIMASLSFLVCTTTILFSCAACKKLFDKTSKFLLAAACFWFVNIHLVFSKLAKQGLWLKHSTRYWRSNKLVLFEKMAEFEKCVSSC